MNPLRTMLLTAAAAGISANNWMLPLGMRLSQRKAPKVYDQPSFRDLILKATTKEQLNDILVIVSASNASPKTIRRIELAYDQRLAELK